MRKVINDQESVRYCDKYQQTVCVFDGCMQELKQLRASYGLLNDKNKKQYEQFTKTSANLSEANKVGLIQLFHACSKFI